ncbi:MAG: cell division protein ZipA C-terminal FtsZ-binding domain-containing protein [Gallionellaceae bacterium]
MSELQFSLLAIGVLVVLVMYGYGWWQQRRHRRRFGATFNPERRDALYSSSAESGTGLPEVTIPESEDDTNQLDFTKPPSSSTPTFATEPDEVCGLLDETVDYVAELKLRAPAEVGALVPLWQRRFDFGKNVNVCGLHSISGTWEKVTPESHASYSAFRVALQLADRAGPVSEVRLSDFRDMVSDIAVKLEVDAELPNVTATVARAMQLDSFCAEVDQMIGLNILPGGDRLFSGSEVAQVAKRYDMSLQADGSFHLQDAQGGSVFSLSHFDGSPLQSHTLDKMHINGLTLLLDVPRAEHPAQRFDEMAVLARKIAMDLRAAVMDDHHVALGEPGIAKIREHVSDIEKRMLAGEIVPGSAQARRLFS